MTQYLLTLTDGEYDDFNEVPLMIVADKDEAYLIAEAIQNKEQPYLDIVKSAFNNDFERSKLDFLIRTDSFGINVTGLPLVSI